MIKKIVRKKIKGDSTYLSTIICIGVICILLVGMVYAFSEIVKTNEVERIHRKYLLSMEREGYLSASNEALLLAELAAVNVSNIDLTGTSKTPVGYGNQVRLVIKGDLEVDRLAFGGGWATAQKGVRHIEMDKTGTALY